MDKVGIIGPKGSGKTTLLRLLLGELPPRYGMVRHGTRLEVAYFDQLKATLDEERTVQEKRLFTKPSNVLVFDEPTNDLDLETLELLASLLAEYQGTVLLVSHDRAFLNDVVTSTLAIEVVGTVHEYAGGYDDYLLQRPAPSAPTCSPAPVARKEGRPQQERPPKLTYKEKQEFVALPQRIEILNSPG